MFEIILYAAIATIVCVMLYSVLGKSVGRGPENPIDPLDYMTSEPQKPAVVEPVEDEAHGPEMAKIRAANPGFTTSEFLDAAQGAYTMILEAFAEGDREQLKELLSPKVYAVYDQAITEREAEALTQVTDLARLIEASITNISVNGRIARISVLFQSELASALLNSEGETVKGDPDLLARVDEVWTFERDLKSQGPEWLLDDVAPSQDDTVLDADDVVDHSPDTQNGSPDKDISNPDAEGRS